MIKFLIKFQYFLLKHTDTTLWDKPTDIVATGVKNRPLPHHGSGFRALHPKQLVGLSVDSSNGRTNDDDYNEYKL